MLLQCAFEEAGADQKKAEALVEPLLRSRGNLGKRVSEAIEVLMQRGILIDERKANGGEERDWRWQGVPTAAEGRPRFLGE